MKQQATSAGQEPRISQQRLSDSKFRRRMVFLLPFFFSSKKLRRNRFDRTILDSLLCNTDPIDAFEPRMSLDLREAVGAKPLRGVGMEEALDDVDGAFVQEGCEVDLACQDALKDVVVGVS